MRPWAIVIAVVAGLGIAALLVFDTDDRSFSRRANAAESLRPAVQLAAVANIARPEQAIIVVDLDQAPPEAGSLLREVRDLVVSSADQSPQQATQSLEQALDKLDDALTRIDEVAESTDNVVIKMRLELLHAALTSVRADIEARLTRMNQL